MRGADVRRHQQALNARLRRFVKTSHRVDEDGVYGEESRDVTLSVAHALGLDSAAIRRKGVTSYVRSRIRRPSLRTPAERSRARSRKGYRTKLRLRYEKGGAEGALKWARQQIGVTEDPPGSNWGKPIQDWIKLTGYNGPVPYCGCGMNASLVHGAGFAPNPRLGYVGYIAADAKGKVNGWSWHGPKSGKPGDLACFGTAHVEMVEKPLGSGRYKTIGFNTSSGSSGSQSNGGGVYRRERATSGGFPITGFARPPYARR